MQQPYRLDSLEGFLQEVEVGHVCLIPEAGKSSVLSRGWREGQPVKAEVPVPSISGTPSMGVA